MSVFTPLSESQRLIKVLNERMQERQQLTKAAIDYGNFATLLAKQNSRQNREVERLDRIIFRLQSQAARLKALGR